MNFLITPFLFIPGQLGLLESVTKDEVITVTVPPGQEFELSETGKYLIYAVNLLPAEDRILLLSQETKMQVETPMTMSGMFGYAADVVTGQPISEFEIEQAGNYKIYLQNLPEEDVGYTLSIVPDYSSQNRKVLFGSCLVHLLIFALIGRQFYFWRNKEKIQREKQEKDKKRAKFDEWMDKQKK
jgi:hypothetical protein